MLCGPFAVGPSGDIFRPDPGDIAPGDNLYGSKAPWHLPTWIVLLSVAERAQPMASLCERPPRSQPCEEFELSPHWGAWRSAVASCLLPAGGNRLPLIQQGQHGTSSAAKRPTAGSCHSWGWGPRRLRLWRIDHRKRRRMPRPWPWLDACNSGAVRSKRQRQL